MRPVPGGMFSERAVGMVLVLNQPPHPAVRTANYSGWRNRSSSSRMFLMLVLEVAGREVEIPAVVGRPAELQTLVSLTRSALGLERVSSETGRHRKRD
jgi:hypothetical protein